MVEYGEEHGKEVDDALGKVAPLDGHVNAGEEEQVAQSQQQSGHQDGHIGGHLRILCTVPAPVSLRADASAEDKAAGHVVIASTKSTAPSNHTRTGGHREHHGGVAVVKCDMLLHRRSSVLLKPLRHLGGLHSAVHHALLYLEGFGFIHLCQASGGGQAFGVPRSFGGTSTTRSQLPQDLAVLADELLDDLHDSDSGRFRPMTKETHSYVPV